MRVIARFLLEVLLILMFIPAHSGLVAQQKKSAAERLGLAPDAKLLIIHADDLALAHSVDAASFSALESKSISCGSIMVPCPWLAEVGTYCKSHPEVDLGIHLTLTSEWKDYRWPPLSAAKDVPGLVDPAGYLWAAVLPVVKNAKPAEIEQEIRAQIERAMKAGVRPTHIDSHMGTLFNPAFFPAYVKVAREYGLPFFAVRMPGAPAEMQSLLKDGDIVPDAVLMANERVSPEKWLDFYSGLVKDLKPGLSEIIVHLARDDAEMQAIAADHPAFGSAWRQRDFDVMTSPAFKQVLKDNNVVVIGWKEIQKVWPKENTK